MVRIEKWFVNSAIQSRRVSRRAEILLSLINAKADQTYLDVGCGNGAAATHIARQYHLRVTGVDVDPEQIQYAEEHSQGMENIRFITNDATRLPFRNSEFDIVSTSKTTHHIPNWEDALTEMIRVLKPNGYFIYSDLVCPEWIASVGKSISKNYGRFPTIDGLGSFIEKNKLSKIHLSKSLVHYETVCQKNES